MNKNRKREKERKERGSSPRPDSRASKAGG